MPLSPPYRYATEADIRLLSPLSSQDLDEVISRLGAGGLDRLIEFESRKCDSYLSKRTSVPLKENPHLSIVRFVALGVSCSLQKKLGEIPDSDQSQIRKDLEEELLSWIRSVTDPSGFVEVPDTNDAPAVTYTKRRTMGPEYVTGPYPPGYGRDPWT